MLIVIDMPPVLVKHIMTTQLVTFFPVQTLPLAEDVMRIHKFRHLPVIDSDRRLVGLVSHRDILRAQISVLTGLTEDQRRARQDEVRVRELMTRDVWTVTPETLASHAGQTLLDHKYSCLPVIDHDRHLCGIVTERDFLKFAIRSLHMHDLQD
ncbi:MAG TPA: CBS domain-containing protein [Kofleriaceae bacterium]|nr:CBS domain-containing protein [Kofleriaceae bacterium]